MLTAYGYFGMWPSEIGRVDEVDFFFMSNKSDNDARVKTISR